MIRVGVIGYGYWGPNVVRNLQGLDSAAVVVAICDRSQAAQKRAQRAFPCLEVISDANEILRSPDVDAVAVITPVWTHFELAKAALENGKHVFV
jgi:predicted dehydrogenase